MNRPPALPGVTLTHTHVRGGRHPSTALSRLLESATLTRTQSGRTALSWWGKFERIGDGHV